jgi:hypothetical protein
MPFASGLALREAERLPSGSLFLFILICEFIQCLSASGLTLAEDRKVAFLHLLRILISGLPFCFWVAKLQGGADKQKIIFHDSEKGFVV